MDQHVKDWKRFNAFAYLVARKLHVLTRENYTPAAATDISATINRAKSRANLKNIRGVQK